MQSLLRTDSLLLDPADGAGTVFDMSGRCAFAVCRRGDCTIKILNEEYRVGERFIFACMPFVNIRVVAVNAPSEIVFGYIQIADVPRMINRWVNTADLRSIQSHPVVEITPRQFAMLTAELDDFSLGTDDPAPGSNSVLCHRLRQDIAELRSRLLVAQVLELYYSNLPLEMGEHAGVDVVFQNFMLALYTHFREHRDVQFYASRSGVSLKYFSTSIKKLSGSSPSEWIETVVAGEAKSLLGDARSSIKDIVATLNFPDAPTFTKYFRRVTGLTPKAYRKAVLQ